LIGVGVGATSGAFDGHGRGRYIGR
jgi:hypothetical protein